MKIAGIEYNERLEALEIFVSGCTIKCPGCSNPQLWDFDYGMDIAEAIDSILAIYSEIPLELIRRYIIVGGEPLDQNYGDLTLLLQFLYSPDTDTILFSGYPRKVALKKIRDYRILPYIDYLKYGNFDPTKKPKTWAYPPIPLSSCNQGIIKI